MQEQRQNPMEEEPLFFDGQDEVIQDEPFELTGEAAYRQRMKQVKREKKSKQSEENKR